MIGWALDHIPWWVPAGGLALTLLITFPYWRPFWVALPSPVKTAVIILATAGLAYLAGRNKGASGALQRAKEQEQARADDIIDRGTAARQRADRDAVSGRLHNDDGFKRD